MMSSLANDIPALERKKEIERKKARLEELRAKRLQRSNPQQTISQSFVPESLSFEEIDELVNSLIGPKVEVKAAEPQVQKVEKVKVVHLEVKTVEATEIIPEAIVSYSKEIQTDDIAEIADQQSAPVSDQTLDKPTLVQGPVISEEEAESPIDAEPISSLDLEKIVSSESFTMFVGQSSKIMERALNVKDDYDIFKDYRIVENTIGDDKQAVDLKCTFVHERWTKNRAVTSMSGLFLCLASLSVPLSGRIEICVCFIYLTPQFIKTVVQIVWQ